ncbi:MAG: TonB family protein [Bacteroidota bacterium]|uniref:TonB C-terminal domain-containing protein n=1 Tax=Christiangramia flava JLT2011 TaxID=1229726 RepID=A0A1L7I6Q2_9FLAO|nr:TonB family protein [Christiangramia flava]APU68795.1 hypothetical protein GRFL_2071 [Christiangramia flava JLT2011]MEE2771184.1 TonB family protein [Bacteroidota bacterium]OSS39060.1 TonB protein [Christiangramia flava JLT2011]
MKKILIAFFLLAGITTYAQEDVKVEGNTVTIKESSPVWPGCDNKADKDGCFNKMLMQHVKTNFKYPKNDKGEYIRGKVTIKMEVNEEGRVVVNSVDGKYPQLNAEAKRMMEAAPKMTPGKRGGKATAIKYTIPLTF